MKAIQDIRRYLSDHADAPSARLLARLPAALSKEESLPLADLYSLDWESFELAIELLRDWRIDRYYADWADMNPPAAMATRDGGPTRPAAAE